MEVTKIKCDNPTCKSLDDSESENFQELRRRRKPLAPPYSWLFAPQIGWYGSGPYVENLIVCSLPCLAPAFEHRLHLAELEK
jgi:hypothetical protein